MKRILHISVNAGAVFMVIIPLGFLHGWVPFRLALATFIVGLFLIGLPLAYVTSRFHRRD